MAAIQYIVDMERRLSKIVFEDESGEIKSVESLKSSKDSIKVSPKDLAMDLPNFINE